MTTHILFSLAALWFCDCKPAGHQNEVWFIQAMKNHIPKHIYPLIDSRR